MTMRIGRQVGWKIRMHHFSLTHIDNESCLLVKVYDEDEMRKSGWKKEGKK